MALHSQQTYELEDVTHSSPSFNEDPKAPSKDVLLPKTSAHETALPRVTVKKRGTLDLLPLLRSMLLPMVAIAFLTFCYVVHYHIVQVRTGIFDNSPQNINSIKSGVTSISILIITLGLYPVYSLISDLKSEEFFRTVRNAHTGASLAAVNGISNPSFGLVESLLVLVQRRASPLFLTAVLSASIAFSTSTVAPAALSVSTALFDSDIMAFTVGAILRDDVQNSTAQIINQPTKTSQLFDRAASVAWVETALQVPYSFKVASNMIVPLPLNLPLNISARWLSDVVVTNPSCTWANPRLTVVPVADSFDNDINIAFLDLGLDMPMRSSSFSLQTNTISVYSSLLRNSTDFGLPITGPSLWAVSRCASGCTSVSTNGFDFNFQNIPTALFNDKSLNQTLELGFLICQPNANIQTREIRNNGKGEITVLGTVYDTPQGNLHPGQTQLLFQNALNSIASNAGPPAKTPALGSEAQVDFIFGVGASNITANIFDLTTTVFTPQSIANITSVYGVMIQSASKVLISGSISKAYVPGRLTTEKIVFSSSLSQVIASTILFIFLIIIIILSHFRSTVPKFTFFSVASSLDGSEIPSVFARLKGDGNYGAKESDLVAALGGRTVTIVDDEVLRIL